MTTLALSHVAPTPNPNAFKFHAGDLLVKQESLSMHSIDDAAGVPLAEALFQLEYVTAVLIAEDFVSVSGSKMANWQTIRQTIEELLPTFDVEVATKAALAQAQARNDQQKVNQENPLYKQVDELIEMYVRPALAGDGGGVELIGIEDKVVQIRYQGACGSCPTSTASTLSAIENLLHDKIDPQLRLQPV